MKSIIIIIAAGALIACAQQPVRYTTSAPQSPQDQALAECQYDAEKATASLVNMYDKIFTQTPMIRKCMEVKGFTRS
jgi:hypothetical protein